MKLTEVIPLTAKRLANPAERALPLVALAFYLLATLLIVRFNTPVDYPVYLMAAYGFLHGENVYGWQAEDFARVARLLNLSRFAPPYPYPPLTALLVAPFLLLPSYFIGLAIWVLLNGLAALITGALLANLSKHPLKRLLIKAGVWFFIPFFTSLYAGQVNPLVVLLASLAFLAYRQRRDLAGSGALTLSLLLKPLAVGLPAYLIWRFRWRAVAGLIVGIIIIQGVAALVVGTNALGFVVHEQKWSAGAYPPAQSLPAMAVRWLTEHPYGPSLANAPSIASKAGIVASCILALLTIFLCWPVGDDPGWSDTQVGLILSAILLGNARTWYHHYTLMVIPLSVLISVGGSRTKRWWILLGVGYILIEIFGVAWHLLVGLTPLLDLATMGGLLIWGLLACEVWRERRCTG